MSGMLVVNAVAVWFMTGVIWLIQRVQYPGFALVGPSQFVAFHAAHASRITPVVGVAMTVELLTSLGLAVWASEHVTLLRIGCVCTLATWALTAWLAVPAHNILAAGVNPEVAEGLVMTNWLRTLTWSAHAIVVAYVVWRTIERR